MGSLVNLVIQKAENATIAFSKFITPNDTGATGGHQAGFHIHKNAWSLFFDRPGKKGENKDKFITIKWQDDFETDSRFIYYGKGTRNEYRLTRFGRGFPFLTEDNVGDLLVITKQADSYYEAFVLQTDDDIEEFFAALNISSTETNGIIPNQITQTSEDKLLSCFKSYLVSLNIDFPPTIELASNARNCFNNSYQVSNSDIKKSPDKIILDWVRSEYELFKFIENDRYAQTIKTPFTSVEELVKIANTILNRRKSRAGKSLEHHLAEMFNTFDLRFTGQAKIEGNKKPDFLFPSIESYLDVGFKNKNLTFLAAKTTCKDRWRQILNEADRIQTKHLFTLQQGVSKNQLKEMYDYNVCLVVPKQYKSSFPQEYRDQILDLGQFVELVKFKQTG